MEAVSLGPGSLKLPKDQPEQGKSGTPVLYFREGVQGALEVQAGSSAFGAWGSAYGRPLF